MLGTYLCQVTAKAGIGRTHLEGSAPPAAFVGEAGNRLRIEILAHGSGYLIRELPYTGADRDQSEWHTRNSLLHEDYLSGPDEDGYVSAHSAEGLLRFATSGPRQLWFYHAGFEYPGGEDTNLSVRYGACERETR